MIRARGAGRLTCQTVLGAALVATAVAQARTAMAQAGGGGAAGTGGGGSTGAGSGAAAPAEPPNVPDEPAPGDPLAPWFEQKKRLEDATGTRVGLNVDLTDQLVVESARSDAFHRAVARYDFAVRQQLWAGAEADLVVRGGWGDGPDVVLDTTVNTNQYAQTGTDAFVLHLWLAQKLADDQVTLRLGKLDVGDWMDTNRYAFYNFVGYSFAHNLSIPLPGNPLAAQVTFEPTDAGWYVAGGVANAEQSSFTIGVSDLFDGETALFAMGEIGIKPKLFGRDGTYRFIGWYDGRDLARIDGTGVDDDRAGVALSFDQSITEQLGAFFRLGTSDQQEFTPQTYWSAGLHVQGPIAGRPDDHLAVGFVTNVFADERDDVVPGATSAETYVEAYYEVAVNEWLHVQPMVQVVVDPGGVDDDTAWIVGGHVALRF